MSVFLEDDNAVGFVVVSANEKGMPKHNPIQKKAKKVVATGQKIIVNRAVHRISLRLSLFPQQNIR